MDDPKNPVLNPVDPATPAGQTPPADPPTPAPPSTDLPDVPPAPPAPETGPFTPPMEDPGFPMPPAPQIETPQSDVPNPEEQPSEGGLPPIITPPSTSSGPKAKIIASIIGLILLVVSIPLGIFLVKQQQEIRSKAAPVDCSSPIFNSDPGAKTACEAAKKIREQRAQTSGAAQGTPSLADCALHPETAECIGRTAAPSLADCALHPETAECINRQPTPTPTPTAAPAGAALKQAGSVGTGGACSTQSECGNNLTCKGGKCLINSGTQECCGIDSQCPGGTCSTSNGICESGKSCKRAVAATGTAPGSVGTGGACTIQADCGDNLTCREINGVKQCRINSGLQGCCGIDSQCPSGQTCVGDNGACESNKSCKPTAATPTPTPLVVGGGTCTVAGIDVYESPFTVTGAPVTNRDNKFKAGDLVRFVAQVPANARKVEICEGNDCAARSKATLPDGSLAFYRDIRLGNIGSVTIKARCTF